MTDGDGRTNGTVDEGAPDALRPKRLAVFCDGTWNQLKSEHLTNVARLASAVKPQGEMTIGGAKYDIQQIVYYDEGVGVGEGVSPVLDTGAKWLGGALGRGLDGKIERAYRFIVLNYQPGDEIYVFGFSRGAYTARSLCGLIRNAGVLRRDEFDRTPEAMELYRGKDLPGSAEAREFRRSFSHPMVAGDEDFTEEDRREIRAFAEANRHRTPAGIEAVPPHIRHRGAGIRYLGVWDTVGALGVPVTFKFLNWLTSHRYRFHDARASKLIQQLRHAVALDERRKAYDVSPVANIQELNLTWAVAHAPAQLDAVDRDGFVPYGKRPYQQRWFPGDHGAVGGGSAERGLSNAALLWIAEGARLAGLDFETHAESELAQAEGYLKHLAPWTPKRDVSSWVVGSVDRSGPETLPEVHESARLRWRDDQTYRPKSLCHVAPFLT